MNFEVLVHELETATRLEREDLLRGFVREEWVDDLDFSTLERKNGSYVSDSLREREDDIVWRAKWKHADEWMYIYFLIEFQSEHDRFMSVRIMNYVSALYQDLVKTGEIEGLLLPPVLPMVVYRGESKWTSSVDVKDSIQRPPGGLSRYLPSLKYLLLDEVRMNEDELLRMCNLAAEIFRIEKSETLRAAIPPFVSFLHWTSKAGPEQDSLKRAVKVWFTRAQKPAKIIDVDDLDGDTSPEEIEPMLSERIERWSKELLGQGRAEGELNGVHKVAKRLLKKGMSASDIAEVTGLTEQEILSLAETVSQ